MKSHLLLFLAGSLLIATTVGLCNSVWCLRPLCVKECTLAGANMTENVPKVIASQDEIEPTSSSRLQDNLYELSPRMLDANGYPAWQFDKNFPNDLFTFARVRYTSGMRPGEGNGGFGGRRSRRFYYEWDTDYPDSDNNFSFRLQELTALKVNPDPVIVTLDGEEIYDYPFVYLIEPGHMALTDAEVVGMRNYLMRGGFMMVDDFWGEWEFETLALNLKRVFPDRAPVELPIEHDIFHTVYDIDKKPMIPSIHSYYRGMESERPDAHEAHYRGMFDDSGRLMMIICHNTDLGDGWEREGVDSGYFEQYSEKWAYPLGINIVVYAMTH